MSKELVFNGIRDAFSESLGKESIRIRNDRKGIKVPFHI